MRIRKFSAYVSLVIVVLLTTLVFFLSTPIGSKASIYLINKFAPIEIGYRKGVILDVVELSHIKLALPGLSLDVEDIYLDFHLRCLWQKRICIDELSLGSAKVAYIAQQNSEDVSTEDLDDNSVLFPWSIKADSLSIHKGEFVINGDQIAINEFSTSVVLTNNQIDVAHFNGNRLAINLADSVENTTQTVNQTTNQSNTQPDTEAWLLANLPEISLPVNLSIHNFSLRHIEVTPPLNNNKTDENVNAKTYIFLNTQLDFNWQKTALTLNNFSTDISEQYYVTSTISLSGAVDFKNHYPMNMMLINNMQKFPLWQEIGKSTQNIKISGDISQLFVNIESSGDLGLVADSTINLTNPLLPFSTEINGVNIPFPQEVTAIATPSMLNFSASGDMTDQTIALISKVTGFGYQQADILLNAKVKNKKLAIESFHFKEERSASELSFSGFVAMDEEFDDKVSWQLALNTSGISLPNIPLAESEHKLSGRIKGNVFSTGEWQGDIWQVAITNSKIDGVLNEQPVSLLGDVSINSQWHLLPSKFNLTLPNIALAIEGFTDTQWHVKGHATANNVSEIIKQLKIKTDEHIDGSIATEFSLSGLIESPLITFNGVVTDLYTSEIVSDSMVIEGQYEPNHNHAFVAQVKSSLIQWQTTNFEQIALDVSGDLLKQKASIAWLGESKADLVLNGEWFADKQYWHGNVSQANLSYLDNEIAPDGDIFIQLNLPTSMVKISKHCWLAEQTQLCLKNDLIIAEAGNVELSIDVGLNFINKLLQKQDIYIDANVTGDINAYWAPNQSPTVNSLLHFSSGSITLTQEKDKPIELMQWSEGSASFAYVENKLSTGFSLKSFNNQNLLDINLDISLLDNYPLSGKAQINQVDLKPVQAFVNDITQLDGMLDGDLTLGGYLYNPIIEGPLDIHLANVKLLKTPTVIQSAKLNLQTQGTHAKLTSEVKINNDIASISGDIDWERSLAFDLSLTSARIGFAFPPQISGTLKPELTAKLQDNKLKLSGRVDVLDGMLHVEKLPEGSVATSSDVVIVDDNGVPIKKDEKFEIETDIRLAIANKFKVKGQGFEGQITGDFQISQQNQQPLQLFGTLKVPKGEYKAYGQHLSVDKGVISFNGAADNPYIDLRAVRPIEKEDITVGINVKGQANALELTIFSNPVMEQPEALSYLTRGRGLDAETGGNAAIGMALGKTLTNSSGILNQIEKLPLLNKLEVDGDGSEASIAGYIGDRVYLKYAIGITEPINELTVRFYILSRLWAETVTGLEESADLYYSFDIE